MLGKLAALIDRLWNWISSPDPTLNRRRLPDYLRLAKRDFRHLEVFYTHVLDRAELLPHPQSLQIGRDYTEADLQSVRAIRARLAPRFRALSDEHLLVTGVFLICRQKQVPAR